MANKKSCRKTPDFARKLVRLIQTEFKPPFTTKAQAFLEKDGTAHITIGRRDVYLSPSGQVLGAGTALVKE